MHLAIVDDLEMDQKALQQQLSSYLDSHHIAYRLSLFSDGENFLAAYRPKQFDGVFLDNGMDRLSGMETARRLRSLDKRIPLIFVTVEESYALEGYTVQAMDYIIKPVTMERLLQVMERLLANDRLSHVIEIKADRMTRQLLLDDILYVRSIGHFLEIHTTNEVLKPYMTLGYLLSLLEQMGEYGAPGKGRRFQNCCRGYLVSFDHVRSLETSDLVLADGSRVPISRSRYKEMQAAYAHYLFARTRITL